MFERYTEQARLAIYYAKAEALQRGSNEIETSDLAVGLSDLRMEPGSPVANLCDHCAKIRASFGVEPRLSKAPGNEEIPLSVHSKLALAYAEREATRDRRYSIGAEHLLRGVVRTGDNTANKLAHLDFRLRGLRRNSKRFHRSTADTRLPLRWWIRTYRLLIVYALLGILFVGAIIYLRSQN